MNTDEYLAHLRQVLTEFAALREKEIAALESIRPAFTHGGYWEAWNAIDRYYGRPINEIRDIIDRVLRGETTP